MHSAQLLLGLDLIALFMASALGITELILWVEQKRAEYWRNVQLNDTVLRSAQRRSR